MDERKGKVRPLLAVCGMDCNDCAIRLRTEEELAYWRSKNIDPERIRCDGCRSERKKGQHWCPDCKILSCAVDQKGIEFCAQCGQLDTCNFIKEFEAPYESHRRAVARLREMRITGIDNWLAQNGYH
ncbi:MAG: DUF3795 domain-containing protein [bacterium]